MNVLNHVERIYGQTDTAKPVQTVVRVLFDNHTHTFEISSAIAPVSSHLDRSQVNASSCMTISPTCVLSQRWHPLEHFNQKEHGPQNGFPI